MPLLDVSELLTDPDFATPLMCMRMTQRDIGHGRFEDVPAPRPFIGVVTMDKGSILKRTPESEYVSGSIMVTTKFELHMAACCGTLNVDADVVTWKNRTYTVVSIGDYSEYGQGFVWAICEPIKLAG